MSLTNRLSLFFLGMLAVVPMLVLASFFYFKGARYLPEDQERARKAGGIRLSDRRECWSEYLPGGVIERFENMMSGIFGGARRRDISFARVHPAAMYW